MPKFKTYFNFIKLEHTLFSLPLIYSGVILADSTPPVRILILVLIAGAGARTVAMALNRIIDREIDKRNPRTQSRELPQRKIQLKEAIGVSGIGLLFYLLAAYLISPLCFFLSPIPLIIFVIYPYLKRFTTLSHLGVGLADSMAPLGGWIAATNSLQAIWPGILLALFTLFWVGGFDIIYATLDEEFDRRENLFSYPAHFGKKLALSIARVYHLVAFLAFLTLFFWKLTNPASVIFLFILVILFIFQHLNTQNVELAFFKINALLGFIILGSVITGIYL